MRLMTTLLTLALTTALLAQDKPQEKPQDKPAAQKDPAAEKKKAEKNELPLETKDKLEFETNEGTWISLDVTPDGQTIVFELLGDIYRVPVAGGPEWAHALIDGEASPEGYRPRWTSWPCSQTS